MALKRHLNLKYEFVSHRCDINWNSIAYGKNIV